MYPSGGNSLLKFRSHPKILKSQKEFQKDGIRGPWAKSRYAEIRLWWICENEERTWHFKKEEGVPIHSISSTSLVGSVQNKVDSEERQAAALGRGRESLVM